MEKNHRFIFILVVALIFAAWLFRANCQLRDRVAELEKSTAQLIERQERAESVVSKYAYRSGILGEKTEELMVQLEKTAETDASGWGAAAVPDEYFRLLGKNRIRGDKATGNSDSD